VTKISKKLRRISKAPLSLRSEVGVVDPRGDAAFDALAVSEVRGNVRVTNPQKIICNRNLSESTNPRTSKSHQILAAGDHFHLRMREAEPSISRTFDQVILAMARHAEQLCNWAKGKSVRTEPGHLAVEVNERQSEAGYLRTGQKTQS
jgi:hypothetical protein